MTIAGKATAPFNELSPAEAERLALLLEELGEVQQVIGKILRHGYESHHPDDTNGPNNKQLLEAELGDVMHAIDRLAINGDVNRQSITNAKSDKAGRVGEYLHHQDKARAPRFQV